MLTAMITLSFMPSQLRAETEKDASAALTVKSLYSPGSNESALMEGATDITTTASVKSEEEARVDAQLTRLEEIKAMDLSTLSSAEKNELREEVLSIKNDVEQDSYRDGDHDRYRDRDRYRDTDRGGYHHGHGGMYLSAGGAILIIVLLIILL